MKRHLYTLFLLVTFCIAATARAADATTNLESRLLRIAATHQTQNPFLPWQFAPPGERRGYGIITGPGEVLTTEHLVRNHTHVEVQYSGSGKKITARVLSADPRLNLALLSLPAGVADLPPLPIAGPLALRTPVAVAQFDDDDSFQLAEGTVNEVGVDGLPDSPAAILTLKLLMQLNVDGEGAPVLISNALAGVVMGYQSGTRIARMVGAPFLERFCADARNRPYAGAASAGFMWRQLVDPAKRAWLKNPPAEQGVLVVATVPGSAATNVLLPLDVLLTWNGLPIDPRGYCADPDFGRIEFSHLVKGKSAPGDQATLRVWRDGAEHTLTLTLGGDPDLTALVPENIAGEKAPYLVSGGAVMRELDAGMLRAFGQDWRAKADPQLLHLFLAGRQERGPGERVVVLTGFLPDRINIGYQQFRNRAVTAINGKPIMNMQDVFAISDQDQGIDRISLDGIGVDIVFERAQLQEANARVKTQYRIPALDSRKTNAAPPLTP